MAVSRYSGDGREVGVPNVDVPGPAVLGGVLPDLIGGDLGGVPERAVPPGDHRVALVDADAVGGRGVTHVRGPEIRSGVHPVQPGQVLVVSVQLINQLGAGQGADVGVVPGVVCDLDLPAVHHRLHVRLVLRP